MILTSLHCWFKLWGGFEENFADQIGSENSPRVSPNCVIKMFRYHMLAVTSTPCCVCECVCSSMHASAVSAVCVPYMVSGL